jgi:phospholipid/cholesterol/gamma-HCH transport system substrate-binding protein
MMEEKVSGKNEFQPPQKGLKVEFFVGLFTLVSLACLGYLAVNIGGIRLFDTGYYIIKAEFDNVSGLEVGAGVEIAGVAVGEVANITLDDVSAVVSLRVYDSIRIREDDIASVRTKGIIGDRYVKIIPGGSEEAVAHGETLMDTESVVDLEEVLGKFIHQMDN